MLSSCAICQSTCLCQGWLESFMCTRYLTDIFVLGIIIPAHFSPFSVGQVLCFVFSYTLFLHFSLLVCHLSGFLDDVLHSMAQSVLGTFLSLSVCLCLCLSSCLSACHVCLSYFLCAAGIIDVVLNNTGIISFIIFIISSSIINCCSENYSSSQRSVPKLEAAAWTNTPDLTWRMLYCFIWIQLIQSIALLPLAQ